MNCVVINSNDIDFLNKNIKKFWSIVSYGIISRSQLLIPDENRALTILVNTTVFKNDHSETTFMWADDHPIPTNNLVMGVKRFKVLENRFVEILNNFKCIKRIDNYIKLG